MGEETFKQSLRWVWFRIHKTLYSARARKIAKSKRDTIQNTVTTQNDIARGNKANSPTKRGAECPRSNRVDRGSCIFMA